MNSEHQYGTVLTPRFQVSVWGFCEVKLNLVAIWMIMMLNLVAMEARPAMMEKSIARQMNTGCQDEMSV